VLKGEAAATKRTEKGYFEGGNEAVRFFLLWGKKSEGDASREGGHTGTRKWALRLSLQTAKSGVIDQGGAGVGQGNI